MARIEDLNVSILEMSYEEAFELVKRLRESRRTKKDTRVFVRRSSSPGTKMKTTKAPKEPKDFASLLTAEQKAALLKELTGG
jgi:ribosomal protein L7/L12